MIVVVRAGPLTTVQDLGRPGHAHLGVPRSGALDVPALRAANALVCNPPGAAGLETTLLGCTLRFEVAARVAVCGAAAGIKLDGVPIGTGDPLRTGLTASGMVSAGSAPAGSAPGSFASAGCAPGDFGSAGSAPASSGYGGWGIGQIEVPAGATLEVGRATSGVRSYVAVAGGIAVPAVLGSRSTDTLSGLGPPKLTNGMILPIGSKPGQSPSGQSASVEPAFGWQGTGQPGAGQQGSGRSSVGRTSEMSDGALWLGVWRGPRDDWFGADDLFVRSFSVSPMSNRIGLRLAGTALGRTREGELESEGVVLGAVQVSADGQPLIFLADHPTTGGYPVVGVVADVAPLAQARPGTEVRFRELVRR